MADDADNDAVTPGPSEFSAADEKLMRQQRAAMNIPTGEGPSWRLTPLGRQMMSTANRDEDEAGP